MHLLARLRWHTARHPWIGWLTIAAIALLTWTSVRHAADAADDARTAWGTSVTVWVTTSPVRRGATVTATARRVPAAVVPDTALTAPPHGSHATHDLADGEILVATDVTTGRRPDPSSVVMAVPAGGVPTLVGSDRVAVFGSGSLLCEGIALDAVAEVEGQPMVEVAVPAACAADLSAHLVAGGATLGRVD